MLFSKSFQKIFFQLILLYFLVGFISKCYIMCTRNNSYIIHQTSDLTLSSFCYILGPNGWILPSYFFHHTSYIIHLPSYIIPQPSSIIHHTSSIFHLTSSLRHQPSDIVNLEPLVPSAFRLFADQRTVP